MKIKKSILQNFGGIVFIIIIGAILLLVFTNKPASGNSLPSNNIAEVNNDPNAQILSVTAKNGFSPSIIQAKANQSTILRVSTQNTFDCSSTISIPSLNISRVLGSNGTTDINLGTQAAGTTIHGTCGMGMYSFEIKFS